MAGAHHKARKGRVEIHSEPGHILSARERLNLQNRGFLPHEALLILSVAAKVSPQELCWYIDYLRRHHEESAMWISE